MASTFRKVVIVPAKQAKVAETTTRSGGLNFLLAEAALDAVGASEEEKAILVDLKNKQIAEQSRIAEEKIAFKKQGAENQEQNRKLEEARQRLREQREQREAVREAAARREAQIQLYFGRSEKREKAAEPAIAKEALPAIVLQDALSLQGDLLSGLKDPAMLRKLKHLQRSLAKTDPRGFAKECQELVLKVQSKVLPKYGFSGDYAGVQNMLVAFEHPTIHQNQDFIENSASLNKLLFGCTFGKTAKESDRDAIFGQEDEDMPAEREVGQKKLADELKRYLNKIDSKEENNREGSGAYKSVAARFFADGADEPEPEADLEAERLESLQLRLRREAANIISKSARQPAGPGAIKEEGMQSSFDGQWEDGDGTTISLENGRMRGPSGAAMDFVIFDGTKCSLSIGNSVYEGRFSTDGRLLWKDGSMWVRKMAIGDETVLTGKVVAAGEENGQANGGGGGVAPGITSALGGSSPGAGGGGAAGGGSTGSTGGPTGRGGSGGGAPGGGDGGGAPGGGDGGQPGGEGQDTWHEEAPPSRVYRQTLPMFHPPDDGMGNQNKTIWRESGMPTIRSQFATTGERAMRKSCYSTAVAAAHGAGGWALTEALREDIRKAVAARSATRFVEAMETLEKIFVDESQLKREINSILGALEGADKAASKNFILQAMPFRETQIFGPSREQSEVQSVFQEPSWYATWEVQPMWMWPLPVMYASHQASLLLTDRYTDKPMKWDDDM